MSPIGLRGQIRLASLENRSEQRETPLNMAGSWLYKARDTVNSQGGPLYKSEGTVTRLGETPNTRGDSPVKR